MRARSIISTINIGTKARDYIELTRVRKPIPEHSVTENTPAEAPEVLEVFRSHRRSRETGHILTGTRVIKAMDEQLQGYLSPSERFANWVTRGSYVSIEGDDRRFVVVEIWWDREAIRVQDDDGYDYMIPFSLIGLWPREDEE